MASTSRQPWIDLTPHGLRLCVVDLPSAQRILMLMGGDRVPIQATALGFHKLPGSGQWVREDLRFRPADFRREFPRMRIVQLEAAQILREARVRAAGPAAETGAVAPADAVPPALGGADAGLATEPAADGPVTMPIDVALMQSRYLGVNYEGDQVWQDAARRFVRKAGDELGYGEDGTRDPALFLRCRGDEDLGRCADGFVQEMVAGRHLASSDLQRFAAAMYDEPIHVTDRRLRTAQEAVEAAMVRWLTRTYETADRTAFDAALQMYERQPVLRSRTSSSVMLQQYSTPLPMGMVGQMLLGAPGELMGRTVLEPTIGHGATVSLLATSKVIGFDLDEARAGRIHELFGQLGDARQDNLSVTAGDAVKQAFPEVDYVITNPPFGGLPAGAVSMQGLRVTRVDHLILMRALEARRADGRAVAIIAGDNPVNSKHGEISGGSRYLFNWLADHYEIEGVAEIDGSLYARQGAAYPVRMVVIGARRDTPLSGTGPETIKSPLPVIRDYEALWSWASEIVSKRTLSLDEVAAAESVVIDALPPTEAQALTHPLVENSWQAPYSPQSQNGEATGMIPRNLIAPTREALMRVAEQRGDVDEYVAAELGWTREELADRLAPEQVDACALMFDASERGRGFIEGDQTGMGKGRVLAVGMVRAESRGILNIFLTEKANLISDLYRDLRDLGEAERIKPFILNSDVAIRDTASSGEILIPATPPALIRQALDSGTVPAGVNTIFATYSQFNRPGAKSDWLRKISVGARLTLDESHVAAGEGNIATVIAEVAQDAAEVVYSSATFAKKAKSMAAYAPVFPGAMDVNSLADTLEQGGETLQEVLSGMLAEDGVFIRREHDLSQLEFRMMVDTKRLDRNREYCDALAPILGTMAYLGGDIENFVDSINKQNERALKNVREEDRKGARLHVSSMEFGSRLYNLNRLFMLGLTVDIAVEASLDALRRGEKPGVVCENTMETLLRDSIAGLDDSLSDADLSAMVEGTEVKLEFRDLLSRTLSRMMVVSERTGYGEVTRREITDENSVNAAKRIQAMIEKFPDLPISPLDMVRERLEAEGYRCEELSGRSLQVVGGEVSPRPKEDRNIIIYRYNGGQSDAIILTRSGSTGISLHASPRFEDQRQRNVVELQIANNVAERLQFWGRFNRKDQVCSPIMTTLSTGLPGQARLLAMQNAKLRKLSANVTSNRSNAAEDETVPDILNDVGDEVAKRLLVSRPDLAERLLIDLPESGKEDPAAQAECYYINRLMGRLMLLSSDQQDEVYEEVVSGYRAVIEDYEARGVNPFKTRELEGVWREIDRKIFEGAEGAASVFERPVYLSTLQGERQTQPIRGATLQEMIDSNEARALDDWGMTSESFMVRAMEMVVRKKPVLLQGVLPEKYLSVEEALASPDENSVKVKEAQLDHIAMVLDEIRLGGFIKVTDEEDEVRAGVVVRIDPPSAGGSLSAGREHLPGQWFIHFALPGDEHTRKMSLYALMQDKDFLAKGGVASLARFDEVPEGSVTVTRTSLSGNLFRAISLASSIKIDGKRMGNAAVWRDDEGVRHRAVLLPKYFSGIEMVPVQMPAKQAADFLRQVDDARVYSNAALTSKGLVIGREGNDLVLSVPGTKGGGGQFFADSRVVAATGDWAGDRERMTVKVPQKRAGAVLEAISSAGASFYAGGHHREWTLAWAAREIGEGPEAPERKKPDIPRLKAS